MWPGVLKWSLPIQVVLLVLLLLLIGQQRGGGEAVGPFPAPPPADGLIGEARTVKQGYAIVDDLRYAGVDRGAVVLDEGRLGKALAHRYPLESLPAEVTLTTRDGRSYRFQLTGADAAGLTLTLLGVEETAR